MLITLLFLFVSLSAVAAGSKKNKGFKKSLQSAERRPIEGWNAYISWVDSNQWQSKRELDIGGSIYDLTSFTGTTQFFAFGMDGPLNKNWGCRVGITLRELALTGDSTAADGVTHNKFSIRRTYLGGELGLRYSPSSWRRWSLLAMIEGDKGKTAEFKVLTGPALTDTAIPVENDVAVGLSLNYLWPITKFVFVEPAFRFGSMVTAKPMIVLYEGIISLKYGF